MTIGPAFAAASPRLDRASAPPVGAASTTAVAASALRAPSAYYRPVVVEGRAFPVARSNYLSLIEILSNWHAPRLRLIGGRWRLVGVHEGIDIAAERGTPVVSMTAGSVENSGWTFYSGTRVGIRGDDGRYYLYAHLSAVAPSIAPGVRVQPGTVIGLVGNTGYGPPGERDQFPPHLHFGIESGSVWVDPYGLLVRLYRTTVIHDAREQSELDRLAERGRRLPWSRLAAATYMHPGFSPRE